MLNIYVPIYSPIHMLVAVITLLGAICSSGMITIHICIHLHSTAQLWEQFHFQ